MLYNDYTMNGETQLFLKKSMTNNKTKGSQMNSWESDKSILLMILVITRLEEKRDLHNIALNRETLSIRSDRKGNIII